MGHGKFRDSRIFKDDMGLFIFVWNFRTSLPKMEDFGVGQNVEGVIQCLP